MNGRAVLKYSFGLWIVPAIVAFQVAPVRSNAGGFIPPVSGHCEFQWGFTSGEDGSSAANTGSTSNVTVTVVVPSTKSWSDTGLVLAIGDTVEIVASGTIVFDSAGRSSGPEGSNDEPGGRSMLVTSRAVPAHSLVGNIAPAPSYDGKGFFVGSSFARQVPINNTTSASGRLLLGFNDGFIDGDRSRMNLGAVADNSGSFLARITVTSAQTPNPPAPKPPLLADPPRATINSIEQRETNEGSVVEFNGSGSSRGGARIVGYRWWSSIDFELSKANSFSYPLAGPRRISVGSHKIYFRVQDEHGQWSDPDMAELTIPDKGLSTTLKTIAPFFYSIFAAVFGVLLGFYLNKRGSKKATAQHSKECPFCCTRIPVKASRCPNCTSELDKINADNAGQQHQAQLSSHQRREILTPCATVDDGKPGGAE